MGNKFGGFGGGNMQQLMKQAQKMQEDMMAAKAELAEMEVVGSAGGGLVEITMKCDKALVGVKLKKEVVDPSDIEMLEDLIVVAYNDAAAKADEATQEKMGVFAQFGGMM